MEPGCRGSQVDKPDEIRVGQRHFRFPLGYHRPNAGNPPFQFDLFGDMGIRNDGIGVQIFRNARLNALFNSRMQGMTQNQRVGRVVGRKGSDSVKVSQFVLEWTAFKAFKAGMAELHFITPFTISLNCSNPVG